MVLQIKQRRSLKPRFQLGWGLCSYFRRDRTYLTLIIGGDVDLCGFTIAALVVDAFCVLKKSVIVS